MRKVPRCLTIAGSDSGGGAGVQADLKTFEALGCFGMSAVTAITAQNTCEVRSVQEIDPQVVADQIDAVVEDIGVDAAKTGMLSSAPIIEVVARKIAEYKLKVVVDPVMVAKSGARLLREDAISTLKEALLPKAVLITPNAPEAEILAEMPVRTPEDARRVARKLAKLGPAVLLKGGHLSSEGEVVDLLCLNREIHEFRKKRIETKSTHGTGCALSAAIAARLAHGDSLLQAVERAEGFIERAIRFGLPLGQGHGPVHHLAGLRNEAARWPALQRVRRAIEAFEHVDIGGLIPEVGANFAVALPYALSSEEVAAVEGRLVRTLRGVRAVGGPWFGASSHIARLLLAIREHDPSVTAAMNVRHSPEILEACRKLRFEEAVFRRQEEPKDVKTKEGGTLVWAAHKIMQDRDKAPDLITDEGEVGKERMIRLLARSPEELIERVLAIHREVSTPSTKEGSQ